MAIEWQDSHSLGDSEIDAQHQTLFVLVNALLDAAEPSRLKEAMANLLRHTQDHFTHEETIMREMGYPDMRTHVEQHNTLISKLTKVSELVANYTFHMANLETYLAAWLFNHIETLDTPLVNYIRLRQGNSPVNQ